MSVAAGLPGTVTFESLPADVAAGCVRLGQAVSVRRGSVLARQGEEAVRCYYVRSGFGRVLSISPQGHEILVGFIGPRDVIGQSAAVESEDRYLATTVASEPMELVAWNREVALQLADRFPEVHARLDALLVRNFRTLMKRIHTVSEGKIPRRLASALLELAARHGTRHEAVIVIEPRVTREDLSRLTGTTLYTVSRVLASWQVRGLLTSRRGRIQLIDLSGLRMLARGND